MLHSQLCCVKLEDKMSDSDKRYIVTIGYKSGNLRRHRVKQFTWNTNNYVSWDGDPNEEYPENILHFKIGEVEFVTSREDK